MLKTLQWGRGLAAAAVAAFHLSIVMAEPRYGGQGVFAGYTNRGNLGVDFFFVLSGFIIAFAHAGDLGQPRKLGVYALKRILRVHPMYWVATLLVLVGAAASGGTNRPPHGALDWLTTLTLVRFTPWRTPIGPAWTLFFEVGFYAIFASLILNARWGAVAMAAWLVAILVRYTYAPWGQWTFTSVLLSAHNLNFFFGMAAFAASRRLGRNAGLGALAIGGALFAATFVLEGRSGQMPVLQTAFGAAFALIILGAAAFEMSHALPRAAVLTLIGDASYSIYLLHENIESNGLKILKKLSLLDRLSGEAVYALIYACTLAAGTAAYLLIEKPMRDRLRSRILPRREA